MHMKIAERIFLQISDLTSYHVESIPIEWFWWRPFRLWEMGDFLCLRGSRCPRFFSKTTSYKNLKFSDLENECLWTNRFFNLERLLIYPNLKFSFSKACDFPTLFHSYLKKYQYIVIHCRTENVNLNNRQLYTIAIWSHVTGSYTQLQFDHMLLNFRVYRSR